MNLNTYQESGTNGSNIVPLLFPIKMDVVETELFKTGSHFHSAKLSTNNVEKAKRI